MLDSLPRRRRLGDPLASPSKIEQLLEQLVSALGSQLTPHIDAESLRPGNYEPVVQLLQAASNFVRAKTGAQSRPCKPTRFPKSLLIRVVEVMSQILNRESQGRVSFRTFTDNNLRILGCPDDIKILLEQGRITLFEALQLKRLNPENLALSAAQAGTARSELLARCRRERWIAHRLRHEIDLRLGKPPGVAEPLQKPAEQTNSAAIGEFNFAPTTVGDSFFAEQLTLMMELLLAVDPGELEKADLERLLNSVDEVILQLQRIKHRQNSRASTLRNRTLGVI